MKILLACAVALLAATLITLPDAEAKRFGGGRSLGKQFKSMPRNAPPRQTQQGAPNPSGGTAASAAGRGSGASRWLGPLAGLAAGGLLASLFFGDGFEGLQIMDILLIAGLVFGGMMLFRAMRRRAPAPAGAGAYGGPGIPGQRTGHDRLPPDMGAAASAAPSDDDVPVWFDGPGFLEGAKSHFIRLQAAWDQADFQGIREYTTPQLLAELQTERERLGTEPQSTEVVTLTAELIGIRREGDQALASILFSGLVREEESGIPNQLREIWHVQHGWESREGDWYIAGIQQVED